MRNRVTRENKYISQVAELYSEEPEEPNAESASGSDDNGPCPPDEAGPAANDEPYSLAHKNSGDDQTQSSESSRYALAEAMEYDSSSADDVPIAQFAGPSWQTKRTRTAERKAGPLTRSQKSKNNVKPSPPARQTRRTKSDSKSTAKARRSKKLS